MHDFTWWLLFGDGNYSEVIIFARNCSRGSFTEGNYSRGDCQVVSSFPEGNFYNENCLGVIVQEQLSLVGTWFSFPRVNCLGDNCPGGKYLV